MTYICASLGIFLLCLGRLLKEKSFQCLVLWWQIEYFSYTPYSSKNSSWFRQDYPATRFNALEEVSAFDVNSASNLNTIMHNIVYITVCETIVPSPGNFNNYRSSWNWSNQNKEKRDSSKESYNSKPEMTSERLTLSLRASGPLTLDEVKNAWVLACSCSMVS